MTSEKQGQKFHTDDVSLRWVMTRHLYEIPALVSQTSFGEETSGDLVKRRLFSQARENCRPPISVFFLAFFVDAVSHKMMEKTKTDTREGLIARGFRVPSDHKPFQQDDK